MLLRKLVSPKGKLGSRAGITIQEGMWALACDTGASHVQPCVAMSLFTIPKSII